jgi:hypothetical protein
MSRPGREKALTTRFPTSGSGAAQATGLLDAEIGFGYDDLNPMIL